MKRTRSFKLEVISVIISTLVVVVTGFTMIGETARLVLVLTIIVGSLAAGIAIGRLIERRHQEKTAKSTSP